MNSGRSTLLFVVTALSCWCTCINSHKVYLRNDVDVTSYPSVGNKFQRPVFDGVAWRSIENSIFKTRANNLKEVFRSSVDKIKMKSKNVDIIFLIDSSSSIGKVNFKSEINFVKKVIGHFDLSFNYTRIALITFSSHSKVIRHIDQISSPNEDHDQCSAITNDIPRIEFFGGGTYTYGALKEAQTIFRTARPKSRKYIFLVTDGFSNGRNPIPVAEELKANNVTIFTIGIQSGNSAELYNISSYPKETHNFLLNSFKEFEKLARGALMQDHQLGYSIPLSDSSRCNILCEGDHDYPKGHNSSYFCCNSLATCECRIPSGHYSCACPKGYVGEGLGEDCIPCIRNTYWINSFRCMPCPDINHVTLISPALSIADCICKPGFKRTADDRCEGITCPKLSPPENGYFVTQPSSCANVLNAACGTRCKSGYQLIGSSLRLCQENGTWSGTEAQCILKTCPSLPVPLNGMITCQNHDLELTSYDYTPQNDTFMMAFEDARKRRTEPMPIDTECTHKCGPGHYLVGSKNRNCLPLSKWDGRQTTCKSVLCAPIPKPKFGNYNLPGCTKSKQPYGTNCTLICPEGFTLKGAETKTCSGKKVGAWTPKYRTSKCVDITPPKLVCPQNYTIDLPIDSDSVVLFSLPPPLEAQDSSSSTVSIWTKPTVDDTTGVRLKIGHHTFTYFASDKFNNKAECNFRVTVLDQTPPRVENCIDPEVFWISKNDSSNQIEWEEPIFTDNSNEPVTVRLLTALDPRKLHPLVAGEYTILYTAKDHSKNYNECLLNITIKEFNCDPLEAPKHGLSYCAKNLTHSWCEATCNLGYALYDDDSGEYFDNFRFYCDHQNPGWKYTTLPDCTALGLPESVGQSFTITVDSENPLCANQDAFAGSLSDQMKTYLCSNLTDCDLISEIPECIQEEGVDETFQLRDRERYHISKRDVSYEARQPRRSKKRVRSSVRIRLYTRISKRLGLWQKNFTLSENIRQMKYQVQRLDVNEPLQRVLQDMQIDVKRLKIEDFIRCPDGSVSKKNICFQCARGTYQDAAFNRCKLCPLGSYNPDFGQTVCSSCPVFYSTRREGRLLQSDCKAQCPPGTWAKLRPGPRKSRPGLTSPHSLMPFCRKCPPGEFQPSYDQTRCLRCPEELTSPRGSTSIHDCVEQKLHICERHPTICGPLGRCVEEEGGDDLYSCVCPEGYLGAQCEQRIDPCHSAPCFNNGVCSQLNETSVGCYCPPEFTGLFCEDLRNPCDTVVCKNGGSCMELEEGGAACECPSGFEGRFCDETVNYCDAMPCESGFCHSQVNGYSCQCPPGIIGRRCHLRPCDNFPCHRNAICVDLMHLPATRRSYICKCPPGLKGHDCMQIDNPCDDNPCVNGICKPVALRQIGLNVTHRNSADESVYQKVTCSCLPYFYGDRCEIFIKPDYSMKFQKPSIQNYVEIDGPKYDLSELSFCTWIKTSDIFTYGSVLSYANDKHDNAFTLTDYSGFVFYVNGNSSATDIVANDGEWHFICATWTNENGYNEIYFDGRLEHVGMNLSAGEYIKGGGVFVIGQEQDRLGGGFSEAESFIGEIAYMDVWDSFLTGEQIQNFYSSCDPYRGSLYSWTDFKTKVHGDIDILPSTFCQKCPEDLHIANGFVLYNGSDAVYHCHQGYKLRGSVKVRHCLRTSRWSPGEPYCELVNCGKLMPPENGAIEYSSGTTLHSVAKYVCNTDFILEGNDERFCPITGVWSGSDPVCMSSVLCEKLQLSESFKIVYANDKGLISSNLDYYPLGVLAEVTCLATKTDDFLTCIDDGTWDGIIPNCSPPETPVALPISQLPVTTVFIPSPGINELPPTSTEVPKHLTLDLSSPFSGLSIDFGTPFNVDDNDSTQKVPEVKFPEATTRELAPFSVEASSLEVQTLASAASPQTLEKNYTFPEHDKDFWPLLYEFLYKGCLDDSATEDLLCAVKSKPISYNNLYTSDQNSFEKYSDLDVHLLNLTESHFKDILSLKGGTPYEDFFDLLLFGKDFATAPRLSPDLENSLRFTLCIIIDGIAWDARSGQTGPLKDETAMENRTVKLKKLIRPLIDSVYENFKTRFSNELKQSSWTESSVADKTKRITKRDEEDRKYYSEEDDLDEWGLGNAEFEDLSGCDWGGLPEVPENGIIMQLWESETFAIGSEVQYRCGPNYETNGTVWTSKCISNGQWTKVDYSCVLTWCSAPAILPNMKLNNPASRFRIGEFASFSCNSGFILSRGNNKVECLPNGVWSKLSSWCRRVSCSPPALPPGAVIVKGSFNLFEDKVEIMCKNGSVEEITCQSDGNWTKHSSHICPLH